MSSVSPVLQTAGASDAEGPVQPGRRPPGARQLLRDVQLQGQGELLPPGQVGGRLSTSSPVPAVFVQRLEGRLAQLQSAVDEYNKAKNDFAAKVTVSPVHQVCPPGVDGL